MNPPDTNATERVPPSQGSHFRPRSLHAGTVRAQTGQVCLHSSGQAISSARVVVARAEHIEIRLRRRRHARLVRAVLGLVGAARARILSAEIFVRAVAPPAPDVAVPTCTATANMPQLSPGKTWGRPGIYRCRTSPDLTKEFQTTLNWRVADGRAVVAESERGCGRSRRARSNPTSPA